MVISGLGVVSPVGTGKEIFWNSLTSGTSGIEKINTFDVSQYPSQIAGLVDDFDPLDFIEPKESRRMDRFSHFAVAATKMALEDSSLPLDKIDPHRIGAVIGSGIGGLSTLEQQHTILLEKGPRRVNPLLVPMMISNMGAGNVSIYFGLKGPGMCVVSACATATHSIGDAFELLQRGHADVCIAGGTEASVTPLAVAGFCAMKALSTRNDEPTKASRPFDKTRDGFVIGEGAGVVVLEVLQHALARGAHIYAEVVGFGMTADAYHITSPDPQGDGAIRAMQNALEQAELSPESVDYINAHGTSTYYNDKVETLAIKKVFGEHVNKVAISSTKSMTGHLLGSSGGIEMVACAMALETGIVPPTINYETVDPECDLNYTPNESIEREIEVAMSNSFGFGGQNGVLVIRKYRK